MPDRPAVDLDARWQRSPDALWRWTTTGVVLLSSHGSHPIGLTHPASVLWDVFEEPTNLADAARLVGELMAAPVDEVLADIAPAVADLVAAGVLRSSS